MENTNRRSFLKKTSIAVVGAGLYSSLMNCSDAPKDSQSKEQGVLHSSNTQSDRLNIGVIGANMGVHNINRMIEGNNWVHCIALCDVNQLLLEKQAKVLKERFPDNTRNMKIYTDFRKLLDDKDIDGVIIATPDHWHTYIYAESCKAGKAVYIEKPTGHTISDCNLMVDMQSKYKNVVTTGLWQISVDHFIRAFNILRSGVLGDVYKVHAWLTGGTGAFIIDSKLQKVPKTFDYKMWLGPTPSKPYSIERITRWSRFWDYGGGQQTMWVHYLDSAFDGLAALGHKRTYPKSIYSVGYKHPETMSEVPALQTSVFEFNDYHVIWEHQVAPLYNRSQGVAWIGSNGTLVCNREGYEIIPVIGGDGKPLIEPTKKQEKADLLNHLTNWAECIKSNNLNTNSPIDKGCYATIMACAANISYRIGSKSIEFLPGEKIFRNNPEADSYIYPDYQNNWKYPQV